MPLIINDKMIQALSPYGADNSFDIGILPGRTRSRKRFFNAQAFYPIPESITLDTISVTK